MQEEVKTNDSFFYRFINLFFKPSATFNSIKGNMSWAQTVIPIIILILVGVLSYHLTLPVSIPAAQEKIEQMDRIPDDMKEEIIQKNADKMVGPLNYILSVIITPIIMLLIGLFFWFMGNVIGGGEIKFITMVGVALYVQMVDIVAGIIKIPLMLSQNTVDVQTSLALAFPEVDTTNIWFNIASQFDVFTIWKITLWTIAFITIYKFSNKKSLFLVLPIWIIVAIVGVVGKMLF